MEQPSTDTNLTGFVAEYSNTQNLFYVGADQHLYRLFWDGHWSGSDYLQASSNSNIPRPPDPMPGSGTRGGTALASNAFEAFKAGFVFYIANVNSSYHVVGLPVPPQLGASIPKGGSLAAAVNPDLTARLGATPARASSPLASFAWEQQQSQHAFYVGTDGNVYWLHFHLGTSNPKHGGFDWQVENLSSTTGQTHSNAPKSGGPLVAYVSEKEGTMHVAYIDGNNVIRELAYSGGSWAPNNLLEATNGAPPPHPNSPLAGYAAEYENTRHVIYVEQDGDVQELYFSGGKWIGYDPQTLTQKTNAPRPASDSALFGWSNEYEATQHVTYSDSSSTLWEIYRSGDWHLTNLSQSAGTGAPPPVNPATPLAAYSFENQKTEHVVYQDRNYQLHELYRSGNTWYAGEKSG